MRSRRSRGSDEDMHGRCSLGQLRGALIGTWILATACGAGSSGLGGPPENVSVDDFQMAVAEATTVLLDTPAVEATEFRYGVEGEVVDRIWVDYRSPTTFAGVQVIEFTAEGGETPEVIAVVLRDDNPLVATRAMGQWTDPRMDERRPVPMPGEVSPPSPISVLTEAVDRTLVPEGTADSTGMAFTRQGIDQGRVVWMAIPSDGSAPREQTWVVHPDGHVEEYRVVLRDEEDMGDAPVPEGFPFVVEVSYRPVEAPDPLPQPAEGTSLDLGVFDLPEDFLP